MNTLVISHVAQVQNPAFGALLLWKFCRSYQAERVGDFAPFHLLFLVMPMTLHSPTLAHITSTFTSSGLTKFASKLNENREELYAIHERCLKLRQLTFDSIGAATASKMLSLDYKTSRMRANEVRAPAVPERLKKHVAGAEKLGAWLTRLPASQVFSILEVEP